MELERTEKANTQKKWIMIGIVVFIVMIVAVNVIFTEKRKKDVPKSVELMTVAKRPLSNTKLISGQVVPGKVEAIYLDPSKGKIKEIYVKEGQEVEKGQKLFTYESADINLQLKQASIDKKITKLNYNQVNDKIKALKKEKKTASDNASLESQLEELENQRRTIELEMEKNQLQEEQLQSKLNQLTIHSPINGYVKNLHQDLEERAGITDEGTSSETMGLQGTPIMNIVSKEPFQIEGTLTELQKAQIQPNQPIKVTANAVPNKSWNGKIVEVSEFPAATNPGTGQLSAEAGQSMSNLSYYTFKAKLHSQEGLSPGYHVAIQVVLSSKKVLAVPQNSVQEKGDSAYVFVVSQGKVQKRNITTGISTAEWTEVVDGLKEGEKVVKNPSSTMDSGMEVENK
ncbi:MAG: efflux RND transporter periplasmic adaptor subunit [Bacillales bacterium]|nr:efflux RND transporter periplasmic adaptor subunit [Bacillales bacterium]